MPIPRLIVALEIPAPLIDGEEMERLHNRSARRAMRDTLLHHHKKRLPEHFKQTARHRYGYAARKPKYKAQKRRQFGSITDLVKTGRMRDQMLNAPPKPILTGSAGRGVLTGRILLRMRLANIGRVGKGVTPADMKEEIEKILPNEEQESASLYGSTFTHEINEGIRRSRVIRKQMAGP